MDHREQLAQLLREVEREGLLSFEEDADWLIARGVQLSEERPGQELIDKYGEPRTLAAARDLCHLYFDIAAAIGEDEVRRKVREGTAVRSVDSLRPPEPTEESLPYHIAGAWAAGYNAGRASVAAPEETK